MPDPGAKILVIDDELPTLRLLRVTLQATGYDTIAANSGGEGVVQVSMARPDLILLDLGRPDMDGLEALRRIQDLTLDLSRRTVEHGGQAVRLTPIEYDLLRVLAQHAGKVMTHRQLLKEVWGGQNYESESHYLRVYVGHLREKLETDAARPRLTLTEPGVGYRLAAPHPDEQQAAPSAVRPHGPPGATTV